MGNDIPACVCETLLEQRWRVAVHVRRGHGGLRLQTPRFNPIGDAADVRDAVAHIRRRYPHSKIFIMGMSAGSAPVVRYLGEEEHNSPISAAVLISPGYTLRPCLERLDSAPIYGRYILHGLKRFFLRPNSDVLTRSQTLTTTFHHCMNAQSVPEFHDRILDLGGYESVDEYYSKSCPMKVAHKIKTPMFILNALDDPICLGSNIHYDMVTKRNHTVALVTVKRGSHCAFLEGFNAVPWQNRVTLEFLKAANHELYSRDNNETSST